MQQILDTPIWKCVYELLIDGARMCSLQLNRQGQAEDPLSCTYVRVSCSLGDRRKCGAEHLPTQDAGQSRRAVWRLFCQTEPPSHYSLPAVRLATNLANSRPPLWTPVPLGWASQGRQDKTRRVHHSSQPG